MTDHDHEPAAPAPSIARRLLVLVAALAMMWGVKALHVEEITGAAAPLTLAAAGFVLLAAFTVGELGASLGLPKVTGYILAGVLVGPQVANILSTRVVSELGTFNTLALGLIATSAGLELHVPAIMRVVRTLSSTVLAKLVLLPILVGAPLVLEERMVGLLGLTDFNQQVVVGLVIAVLGIGTSPAIALAVVSDTGAKGRLSDLLLAIAVAKDVVVVVCLAIAVALCQPLLGGGHFHSDVLVHLGTELGASVAAGALVGALLIGYFRYVGAEPLFTALVAILLVAEASKIFHLELLLVFIVAGFLVRNLSPYEHALLDPIERIALPVYVVFFTVAGAAIDLLGTLQILPLAIGLVALRAGTFYVAARIGSWVGGEEQPVSANAWLTYLPQAGVTLGLVLLAADKLPEVAGPIKSLGLALVALNLLVGPIALTVGLKRSGEVGGGRDESRPEPARGDPQASRPDGVQVDPSGVEVNPTADDELLVVADDELLVVADDDAVPPDVPIAPIPAPPVLDLMGLSAQLESDELSELMGRLGGTLEQSVDRFLEETVVAHALALRRRAKALAVASAPGPDRVRDLGGVLATPVSWTRGEISAGAARLFDVIVGELRQAPRQLRVPLEAHHLRGSETDTRTVAAQRRVTAIGSTVRRLVGRTATRTVPAQLVVRLAWEPRLAEELVQVMTSWHRSEAELLAAVQQVAQDTYEPDSEALEALATRWEARARHALKTAVNSVMTEAVHALGRVGGPELPARSVRYAEADARVGEAVRRLQHEGDVWIDRLAAAEETLRVSLLAEGLIADLAATVERRGVRPLRACREAATPILTGIRDGLDGVIEGVGVVDETTLAKIIRETDAVLSDERIRQLRRIGGRFRRSIQAGLWGADLAEVARTAPTTLRVISKRTPLHEAHRPDEVVVQEVAFADIVRSVVQDELLPAATAVLTPVARRIVAFDHHARESVTVARYGAESAAGSNTEDPASRRRTLVDAYQRADRQLELQAEQLTERLDSAEQALLEVQERATSELRALSVDEVPSTAVRTLRASLRAVTARARGLGQRGFERARHMAAALWSAADREALRDVKLRSGHEMLDASGIRAYLDERWPAPAMLAIPAVYSRLMAPEPLTERRLFVARSSERDALLKCLVDPTDPTASTLVVGPTGIGRSSLLNQIRLQLVGPRLIWLDPTFSLRATGLATALATELGTPSGKLALLHALQEQPTVVVIDDLHRWVAPSVRGMQALEHWLDLMQSSVPHTRWLVSMEQGAFAVLDEAVGLRRRFRRVLQLRPLDWTELASLFARREQLGGFDTDHRTAGLVGRVVDAVWPERHREVYHRALAHASAGRPGLALALHMRSVRAEEGVGMRAGWPSPPSLPFLPHLGEDNIAVLAALARWGPMGPETLQQLIGTVDGRVPYDLDFLLHTGLVEMRQVGLTRIHLNPRLASAIAAELGRLSIAGRPERT